MKVNFKRIIFLLFLLLAIGLALAFISGKVNPCENAVNEEETAIKIATALVTENIPDIEAVISQYAFELNGNVTYKATSSPKPENLLEWFFCYRYIDTWVISPEIRSVDDDAILQIDDVNYPVIYIVISKKTGALVEILQY